MEVIVDPQKKALKPNSINQDESIMGTNNSSIVSKRSVERLYYPDEPHFFRYFVKKPKRRSPLINRGYWLRMKAIESVVHRFLKEPSEKPKLVINLGCGYDPNPWQCLSRYPEACGSVIFIDVDYMPLMVKKRDVVKKTPELNGMLTNLSFPEYSELLLRSDQYLQVGCDLNDLSKLSRALATAVDLTGYLILYTAEVSITYMNVQEADDLIEWTCQLPDARFCLLEQILPGGPDHPFAKTMLAHFDKLRTPLKAARKYLTVASQKARFQNAGWTKVWAQNLWDLWEDFLTPAQRAALDDIEPFDEWEEFALFSCHYFLLLAINSSEDIMPHQAPMLQKSLSNSTSKFLTAGLTYFGYQKSGGYRRFAAPLPIRRPDCRSDLLGSFAGMGQNARINSYDLYSPLPFSAQTLPKPGSLEAPPARMCHTITDLGEAGALLVGGRSSPDSALADCWLYHKWTNTWERVDNLPSPRYRHSAIILGEDRVLVAGGKGNSGTIMRDIYLWHRHRGWTRCILNQLDRQRDSKLKPSEENGFDGPAVFGAILATTSKGQLSSYFIQGILAGGISSDNVISTDLWFWTLEGYDKVDPLIRFERKTDRSIARFGANIIRHAGQLLLLGGVHRDFVLTRDDDILRLEICYDEYCVKNSPLEFVELEGSCPRPFLIGSTVSSLGNSVVITGGGAVCFSFGTCWNSGCFSMCLRPNAAESVDCRYENGQSSSLQDHSLETWRYLQTIDLVSFQFVKQVEFRAANSDARREPENFIVPRTKITSAEEFSMIVSREKPLILEEAELGTCTRKWTSEYLIDHVGRDKNVVVHQASSTQMDFLTKNFQYISKPFGGFMEAVEAGDKLYLRSLSANRPADAPAELRRDFPAIADDFKLPPQLRMVDENAHSSPLRISGPVNMWLHYDVMANVLCQIRGSKRLLLFPPHDIHYFKFPPGASSSSIDVFSALGHSEFASTHPHEATLRPGDILFIPAFWLHCASPIEGVSIAVNVFFRNLDDGYAAGKDVYGNRDLKAYEKGRQYIARIGNSFSKLPADVRYFYMHRLAEELRDAAGARRE